MRQYLGLDLERYAEEAEEEEEKVEVVEEEKVCTSSNPFRLV